MEEGKFELPVSFNVTNYKAASYGGSVGRTITRDHKAKHGKSGCHGKG